MKRRTARGQTLDMAALAAKHETQRAVSNVPINARGDIIDSRGEVQVPKEQLVKKAYDAVQAETANDKASIKEDKPIKNTKATKEVILEEGPIELGRTKRTRSDGSEYYEIEYSDGSMGEEPVL